MRKKIDAATRNRIAELKQEMKDLLFYMDMPPFNILAEQRLQEARAEYRKLNRLAKGR